MLSHVRLPFTLQHVAVALVLLGLMLAAGPAQTATSTLPPPTLVSPPDGIHTTGDPNAPAGPGKFPPLGIPTFVWNRVEGATKYKLEVSTSPVFNPLIINNGNLTYPRYTPTGETGINSPGLTDDTLFYWRVSAWDPIANAWTAPSATWSFTRHWVLRPTLRSPTNGAIWPFTPRFEWDPVLGTRQYELQISTSPTFQSPTIYYTKLPTFTPQNALANDTDYYWRVRARDKMDNPGQWSNDGNGWQFRVRWSYWAVDGERRPRPLTPPNLTTVKGMPLFSWTPVAGAKMYEIELNKDPNFIPNYRVFVIDTPNTAYAYPLDNGYALQCNTTYYWRVRAKNNNDYWGQWTSDPPSINYAFLTPASPCPNNVPVATGPSLLYPLAYYDPSINVGNFSDRTMPLGTFMWDHFPGSVTYTLEVDDDPVFNPPLWVTSTQNLNVTLDAPFEPGVDYYWRVRADPPGSYSDIWNTRINPALLGSGTITTTPQLLRPTYKKEADERTYGWESVEYWPSFEWLPVNGAARYRIQIAQYSDMTGLVEDTITRLPDYTPLTRHPWGTYYWRVQALDGNGVPIGSWSSIYRFVISSQIQIGLINDNSANDFPSGSLLASDPGGDAPAGGFDLRELYTAISRNSSDTDMWYIGLQTGAPITAPVRYGIYLDKNRAECINAPPSCDGGATTDPLGMNLSVTAPHLPEYAIYLDLNGGTVTTATLYSWSAGAWGPGIPLSNLAGAAFYDTTAGFIKIGVPFTAIGNPASISFMAFSANPTTGQAAQDTVPSNASNTNLVSFITDSQAPTPVLPPNNALDPSGNTPAATGPIYMWHAFDGVWSYRIQVALDFGFSNIYHSQQGWTPNTMAYDELNPYYPVQPAYADNSTYYWRMAMVYSNPRSPTVPILGQFGEPSQFSKFAPVPVDLQVTPLVISTTAYTWRSPTFLWDPAEAASQYRLKVYAAGSPNPVFTIETAQTSYTWVDTLDDGAYNWTLEAKDAEGNYSANLAAGWFTKVYSAVVPLYPLTPTATLDPLEFRWEPIGPATSYEVQTARDPNFSSYVDDYTTYSIAFTPEAVPRALQTPGDLYWRVRLKDGTGHYGPWVQLYIPAGGANKVYIPIAIK